MKKKNNWTGEARKHGMDQASKQPANQPIPHLLGDCFREAGVAEEPLEAQLPVCLREAADRSHGPVKPAEDNDNFFKASPTWVSSSSDRCRGTYSGDGVRRSTLGEPTWVSSSSDRSRGT